MSEIELESYAAYKYSGEDWIGEVPAHWSTIRFKNLFHEVNERSADGGEDLLSVSQFTGVTKSSDGLSEGELLTTASTLEGYKKVSKGDLVTNIMLAWNGSLGFSSLDGITSPAYSVYRLKDGNDRGYFHYLLRTEIYKAEFKRNSSGVIDSRLRLYTENFFRISSILPPPKEQTAIARFLDRKTALIDKAIAIKEKQIELLKERRQILIHQAVTRGLNPKVKMKDSGVEWIGEVPIGWNTKKLKYVIEIANGQVSPRNRVYENWILIGPNHIEPCTGTILLKQTASEQGADSGKYIARKGMLIYSKIRPELRKACVAEEDCLCSADMYPISTQGDVTIDYLKALFLGELFNDFMVNQSLRVAMPKVNREDVLNYCIAYPPLQEQREIVAYIDRITKTAAVLRASKEAEIDRLNEFRSTLVNCAVTGKIKVS